MGGIDCECASGRDRARDAIGNGVSVGERGVPLGSGAGDCEYRGQVVQLDRGYPLVELDASVDFAGAVSVGANSCGARPDGAVSVGANSCGAELDGANSSRTQHPARIRCEYGADMRRDACVVGDYVRVRVPPSHDNGVILEVERRSRQLVRKDPSERAISQVLAANFDTVFIVQPINDVNLSRLQRELVVSHQTGACVVVLLTKADLVCETSDGASRALSCVCEATGDDLSQTLSCVREVAGDDLSRALSCVCEATGDDLSQTLSCVREVAGDDVCVLAVSTQDAQSVEEVRALVPAGELAVMMGRSGAGKSSLINALVGQGERQTANVRERDGRGRHTTVNRVIVDVPDGGRVVDMPGVRGLGVWEAEEGLDVAFPDIAELSSECKFRDCTHKGEPGCRVCEAVELGVVSRARLDAYLAFVREIDVQRAKKEENRRASGAKKSDRKKKSGRSKRRYRGR